MDVLHNLAFGFSVAFSPANFAFCLFGAAVGTFVGILPGIGPVTTIAMLLPITFKLPAVGAIIMLSGIYYGAHHSGSTTAIMLNMPGEPSSVVICIDGAPMARKGQAGPALAIAAIASFVAGCVGFVVVATLSPVLARLSLAFGPTEYFSTIVMALVLGSVLSGNSLLTTLGMSLLGLLIGCVGTDMTTGDYRYNFGVPELAEGVDFVAVAVGVFAFGEIIMTLRNPERHAKIDTRISGLMPTRKDLRRSVMPILRSTALGAFLGIFPGTGPLLASFAAYAMERQLADEPSRFGQGAIEGVAGPEAANNAAAITHYIPMLTLGIPAGAAMALMLGALQIQGITPGPEVVSKHADLFWGVIASMWIGNMMLLVLNLPMIGLWVRALLIPFRLLYPAILAFCCVGVFSVNNTPFDVLLAALFGLFGVFFKVLDCHPAPLVLAVVLEPLLEGNFRRAMIISNGDATTIVTHPFSLAILVLTAVMTAFFAMRKGPLVARPGDAARRS
jgi:TctA family transporter